MSIQIYDCAKDELVPVTQKWCDDIQNVAFKSHKIKLIINKISSFSVVRDAEMIDELAKLLGV